MINFFFLVLLVQLEIYNQKKNISIIFVCLNEFNPPSNVLAVIAITLHQHVSFILFESALFLEYYYTSINLNRLLKKLFIFFSLLKIQIFIEFLLKIFQFVFFRQSPITLMIYLFFLCLLLLFFYFLFQFMFSFIYSFGSRSRPRSPGRPGPARPISTPLLPITTI